MLCGVNVLRPAPEGGECRARLESRMSWRWQNCEGLLEARRREVDTRGGGNEVECKCLTILSQRHKETRHSVNGSRRQRRGIRYGSGYLHEKQWNLA